MKKLIRHTWEIVMRPTQRWCDTAEASDNTESRQETSASSLTYPAPPAVPAAECASGGDKIQFWYSKEQAMALLAGLFLIVRLFGELTPPFQSPDEFNHIKRAYLLSKGVIAVGSRGTQTGG